MEICKARPRTIHKALRISISGDKFPAGGKRNGLKLRWNLSARLFYQSRKLEPFADLVFNLTHRGIDHPIRYFRIDLCCGRVFMSQHLTDRFQRNTIHQSDRHGKRVPPHVDNQP